MLSTKKSLTVSCRSAIQMESRGKKYLLRSVAKAAAISLVVSLLTGGGCSHSRLEESKKLTVYAGAGITKTMEELAPVFTGKTGYQVDFEFASSGSLAKKIAAGAPCDLFISANREWMEYLGGKNYLDSNSIKTIAESELVCVIPKHATTGVSTPLDLARLEKIALGDPSHVPAGKYARQALRSLDLWDTLSDKNKLVLLPNVMQALYLTARGEVDAAIVYLADAKISDKVKTAFSFPSGSHQPVEFIGAVVLSSTHKSAARSFLDFLATRQAGDIIKRTGFKSP
jgi:molybdate transport system substrate-binding protein